jgi:Family of unknown function (DUF6058)
MSGSIARRQFGGRRSVPPRRTHGDDSAAAEASRRDHLAMLTAEDVAYITANFVPLRDDAIRAEIAAGRLPKPAYVLDDGTEMVAPDHLALIERAGGIDALRDWLEARAPGEWEAYLSGEYAVCLRSVSPESIVRKGELIAEIDSLLDAEPPPERLRAAVDELDALLRPFAPYDRIRFGGPVSRDRYVTAVRERLNRR